MSSAAAKPRVLVTGASGQLGRMLAAHLRDHTKLELVLLDRDPRGDARVRAADLSTPDPGWAACFAGIDAVLHLAGAAAPASAGPELERSNIDLLLHVLDASVAAGVRRFVFASSNFVMAGHRHDAERLDTTRARNPSTAYGYSKAAGERICERYVQQHGLSVICLRIGAVAPEGRSYEAFLDPWYRQMWLSKSDLCQVVERALLHADVQYAVLNAMSDNVDMRWDLSQTHALLGYLAQDSAPRVVEATKLRFARARALFRRRQ